VAAASAAAVLVVDILEAVVHAAVVLGSAAVEAEAALAAHGSRGEWVAFMGGSLHLEPVHRIVNRSITDKPGWQVRPLDRGRRFIRRKIVFDRLALGTRGFSVRRSRGRISGL
jgi:hypothetical protein